MASEMEEQIGIEEQYRSSLMRKFIVLGVALVALFIVSGWALTMSEDGLGFFECWGYIFRHIAGHTYEAGTDGWMYDYNIWKFDVPRILMAIIVGGGLAVCGVAMQAIMNNPLADPYTMGISDGAVFGAVAAIVMGFGTATLGDSLGLITSAFFGGLIPAVTLILLARAVSMSPATAILVGIALSYIFSGLESAIMVSTDPDTLKAAYLWQIGSLSQVDWMEVKMAAVITLIGAGFLLFSSRKLNLLSLGDDTAKSLGLNVDNFRTVVMIAVAVVVASTVSFVGIVGFVGLVAPHIIRLLIGADNKFLMPISLVTGAFFIQLADSIAHNFFYPELRVGLIISIIGAPLFLYIILRKKKNYGEAL